MFLDIMKGDCLDTWKICHSSEMKFLDDESCPLQVCWQRITVYWSKLQRLWMFFLLAVIDEHNFIPTVNGLMYYWNDLYISLLRKRKLSIVHSTISLTRKNLAAACTSLWCFCTILTSENPSSGGPDVVLHSCVLSLMSSP